VELSGQLTDESLERAVSDLADAEAELIAYRDNASARAALEVLGGDHFEQGLHARVAAVMEARDALERARRAAVGIDLGPATAIWPELSVDEKRRLLTEGVDAVFLRRAEVIGRNTSLDGSRVKVFWRGEAPRDLPGPGIRVELRSLDW
jgi:hypothetical protein